MSSRRTALVTGGSGGIGHRLCRELARQETTVILHAPTLTEAHTAADDVIRAGADPASVHAVAADFRSLTDVIRLAGHLRSRHDTLDLLINNAGALAPAQVTSDGFDATFQINYLAPYALTRLLAPALNKAAGRVVMVTSAPHRQAHLDPDRPGADAHTPAEAYTQAQLALILFTRALARTSEQRVTAVAVHPGHVDTGTFTAIHGTTTTTDGAAHVLHAADAHTAIVNGAYYEGKLAPEPAPQALDDQAVGRLWLATARLLGWDYTAARLQSAT